MKRYIFYLGLFFISIYSFSHEFWADLDNFYLEKNEKIKVFACAGHSFPTSTELINENIFDGFYVITPDKEEKVIKPDVDDKKKLRFKELSLEKDGTYLIYFLLKKPQIKDPLFIAKTYIKKGLGVDSLYSLNNFILDIIPEKDIFGLKIKEELPLKVLYKGEPVSSITANVSVNGEKNFFLKTNKEGRLFLKISSYGRYLITVRHKGTKCSFVFYVKG